MGKQASATIAAQRETAWRSRLARRAASRLTVEAFCRREAVSVATFYGWQARLRARDTEVVPASPAAHALSLSPFLDLGSVNRLAASAASPSYAPTTDDTPAAIDIRLDLGGGVVLHIARH